MTLYSSDIATPVYNDTKYTVLFMTLWPSLILYVYQQLQTRRDDNDFRMNTAYFTGFMSANAHINMLERIRKAGVSELKDIT